MRGRKPIPTVLTLLKGNPGKRPINAREPKPTALPVECPPEVTSADGQLEWARTIVPAIQRWQITSADRVFAIAHCELWATWREQVTDAARHPHVVATKTGHPMPNPARCMANRTLLLLARIDAELGLTPASRSRVHAELEAEPTSKWAGHL